MNDKLKAVKKKKKRRRRRKINKLTNKQTTEGDQQVCEHTEQIVKNKWTHCKYFNRLNQVAVDIHRAHHRHLAMSPNSNNVNKC